MQTFNTPNKNHETWYRHYLNSKAIVVNPADAAYLNIGEGASYTNMSQVLGGMFGAAYPTTGNLQGGIDTPSTAWAAINLAKYFKVTGNEEALNRLRLIGDFFVNKVLNIKIWNSSNFKAFPNSFTYNANTLNWEAKTNSIQTRTFLHVAWALLEIYDVTREDKYADLAGQLLDTVRIVQTVATGQSTSNELPPYFKGSLFNALESSDGVNYDVSWTTFSNVCGDVMVRATQKWTELFGNETRTAFDLYAWNYKNYTPKMLSEDYFTHLQTMYHSYGLRKSDGHKLLYNFSHYSWSDPAHADGYMIPVPKNWDFINDVWGQDQWFTGDLMLWSILGFAEAGYKSIAITLLNQFYTLKAPDSNGRLLFHDRYTAAGTPLPEDQSKSIAFTALFLNAAKTLGFTSYEKECVDALDFYQKSSEFVNVDGSYSWNTQDPNAVIENKSLGEILYAIYSVSEVIDRTVSRVSTLPTAPSRLGRATEFVRESSIFLALLPKFREELNALAAYWNNRIPNPHSYGKLATAPLNFENIPDIFTDLLESQGNVQDFIADLDKFGEELQFYSTDVNSVAEFLELLTSERNDVQQDLLKPWISGIAYPPARSDTREEFNNNAEVFIETLLDHIFSLKKAVMYHYMQCVPALDHGFITEEATEELDFGSITDNFITT